MENGVNKASGVDYVCVRHCSSERNANYWASGSVKCTAVATVSARWTIELVCNLTVGGVSHSHPQNLKVASPRSPDVNQPTDSNQRGIQAQPAMVRPALPPSPTLYLYGCVCETECV